MVRPASALSERLCDCDLSRGDLEVKARAFCVADAGKKCWSEYKQVLQMKFRHARAAAGTNARQDSHVMPRNLAWPGYSYLETAIEQGVGRS